MEWCLSSILMTLGLPLFAQTPPPSSQGALKLTDARALERSLATISNHIPNRYILSFQPQSPHPGLHVIGLTLPDYSKLAVTARTSYWVDPEVNSANPLTDPH